ncbi:MAG: GntR family transcriptional regulator [Thermomicrobiales bacterium]
MSALETSFAGQVARFAARKSLSQEIAALIKQALIDGTLAPGDRIVESKLAQDLGVSLTPVREAVRELAGQGILTVSPNRGPSVRILTPEDALELYSLRAMLEGLAIRLAIVHATPDERAVVAGVLDEMAALVDDETVSSLQGYSPRIHDGIVQLSKHERLIATYQSLALQIALLNRVVAPTSSKQHEVDWHRPVIAVLLGDDCDRAERVLRDHIREACEVYMAASGAAATRAGDEWF